MAMRRVPRVRIGSVACIALAIAAGSALAGAPRATAAPLQRTWEWSHDDGPDTAVRCFDHTRYVKVFGQRFTDAQSWRQSNGGIWATEYPWGRTNPGADDAAYHIDETQGLGDPVFDPFSIVGSHTLAIEGIPARRVPGLSRRDVDGYPYVSGVISTAGPSKTAYRQQWGYYEARMQMPAGQGLWPSFWMLDSWGGTDEIDAVEFLGEDVTTVYQSVHYATGGGSSYPDKPPFDPTTGFHEYGVLVTPQTDTYYVDGVATHSVPNAAVNPMYFMISFSIGGKGSWPGQPDKGTPWPSYLYVRHFHAFAPTKTGC